jgi:D-alanine-D-alanine ligase
LAPCGAADTATVATGPTVSREHAGRAGRRAKMEVPDTMPINVNKAVDKAYETKTLKEIADAPVAALEGLSDEQGKLLAQLKIKTIRDLGEWKFAAWARAIVDLSKLEELSGKARGPSMRHIAVIQGGPSSEAEVSRTSAAAVAAALGARGHRVERIELDGALPSKLATASFDLVFPVVHGALGEDGCLQGLLELLGLPYVGCGVLASSLAMDKPRAKVAFRAAGLPVAPELELLSPRLAGQPGAPADLAAWASSQAARVRAELGRAVVVKPATQGSAIGVTRIFADDADEALAQAIASAFVFDDRLLCERFVVGREVTCGVTDVAALGGPRALPPTEIKAKLAEYYDFRSRYAPGGSDHTCPAALPPGVAERVQQIALAAHAALGCRDLSRADFVVGDGEDASAVTLLEVNTMPGMTATSLYPEAMGKAGHGFEAMCEALVSAALARASRRAVPVLPMPTAG